MGIDDKQLNFIVFFKRFRKMSNVQTIGKLSSFSEKIDSRSRFV